MDFPQNLFFPPGTVRDSCSCFSLSDTLVTCTVASQSVSKNAESLVPACATKAAWKQKTISWNKTNSGLSESDLSNGGCLTYVQNSPNTNDFCCHFLMFTLLLTVRNLTRWSMFCSLLFLLSEMIYEGALIRLHKC